MDNFPWEVILRDTVLTLVSYYAGRYRKVNKIFQLFQKDSEK